MGKQGIVTSVSVEALRTIWACWTANSLSSRLTTQRSASGEAALTRNLTFEESGDSLVTRSSGVVSTAVDVIEAVGKKVESFMLAS